MWQHEHDYKRIWYRRDLLCNMWHAFSIFCQACRQNHQVQTLRRNSHPDWSCLGRYRITRTIRTGILPAQLEYVRGFAHHCLSDPWRSDLAARSGKRQHATKGTCCDGRNNSYPIQRHVDPIRCLLLSRDFFAGSPLKMRALPSSLLIVMTLTPVWMN